MGMRVAVMGAGSWGTTVAALAAGNAPTVLWARRAELARRVAATHVNDAYLPEVVLPASLHATASVAEAVGAADVVVMAVPSHGFRGVVTEVAAHLRPWVPVVSLTKGIELGTRLRMTEIVGEVVPGHPAGVLTGPNLAREIVAGQPAAAVLAMTDQRVAEALQGLFSTSTFRVYTNPDLVGCEVAGALKNVMAIAVGMVDGMGFGDNTRATMMTRGLAELTRLGVALGGEPLTFAGLAGMGDLVATCSSSMSRNHHVGTELGRGRPLEEIVAEMNMVAEGVKTSEVVCQLAHATGVEVPIAEQVHAVCHQGRSAREALNLLMLRQSRPEMHGLGG